MGVFQKSRKFVAREVRYVALGMVNAGHVSLGYKLMKRQLARFKRGDCPLCLLGDLHDFAHEIDAKRYEFRGCSNCQYFEPADLDPSQRPAHLANAAAEQIRQLPPGDYISRLVTLRTLSRAAYCVSALLMVVGAVWWLYSGDWFVPVVCTPVVAALAFAQGMVASYRYSQFRQQSFFVPGAFKAWLKRRQLFV
jgi:hypothetical protein